MRFLFAAAIFFAVAPAFAAGVETTAPPGAWTPDPETNRSYADYPSQSVRLKEQGTVILRVLVKEDGNVGDVQLVQSSGFPHLDESAMKLVLERFKYKPARDGNGKPIATWTQQGVKFRLEESDAPERQPIPGTCRDQPLSEPNAALLSARDGARTIHRQLLIKEDGTIERILVLSERGWTDADQGAVQQLNQAVRYFGPRRNRRPVKCWIDADTVVSPR